MNTLGLIGGTSWHSTIVYYRLLNELAVEKIGSKANPPLILYSLNVELMREQNEDKIKSAYLEIAGKLQTAGATAILICANTPHLVYDYVQKEISIPILHIADAVGHEAAGLGLNHVGLLGTAPTMRGNFLQRRLSENFGIQTIIPDEEFLEEIHHYIAEELTQGKFTQACKRFFLNQIQLLKEKGAKGVVMGCTELPMLIAPQDTDLPLLQTTDLHAKMGVDHILKDSGF